MGISINSAQTNLVNDLIQKEEIQHDLSKALKNLSKNPNLALMQIMMILSSESGGTLGLAENGVGQDAQKMNMMTALAAYTTKMTKDINTISSSTSTAAQKTAAAKDLIKQGNNLKTALKTTVLQVTDPVTGLPVPWIDPATGSEVHWIKDSMAQEGLSSLNSFMNLIGARDGSANVVKTIKNWLANPTSGNPTGQQQIQSMNKGLAVMSNLFQSLSTSAQNVVKEGNTTLTQYQSNEGTLFTDFIALNKAIVAHLGGN